MSEITARDGRIQQTDFNGYQIARIHQAPQQTYVHLAASQAAPAGVGETRRASDRARHLQRDCRRDGDSASGSCRSPRN